MLSSMRIFRKSPASAAAAALAAVLAAICAASGPADASDEKAFLELKTKYEKLAKIHDENGIRERRKMLFSLFDYIDQKACRKLLRDAFEADDSADTRCAAVQVLAATGDPKDLDVVVKGVARDKLRGPTISIGIGVACTAKDAAPAISTHAVELASKSKGDLRFALLEGVAELAEPTAYDPLAALALDAKATPEERYVKNVALGACGKEKAVPALTAESKNGNPVIRLGAVTGLVKTGAKESLTPLTDVLHDLDPRIVETSAAALGAAKHQPASGALVDAMAAASLRSKLALRGALTSIVGKDYGMDPAAWRDALSGKKPEPPVVLATAPKPPEFFGVPVASDRVAVVLDLSHRMGWNGRLVRAKEGICAYLSALDDSVEFNVYTCASVTESFSKSMCTGAASRSQADAWIKKQLNAGGFDLERCLIQILAEQPDVDTILLATESMPWGDSAATTAMEAIEVFRRANLTRRVHLHVAFVVPGGRVTTSETNDDFEDRATLLQLLAESSGGKFVRVDQ
jgi:HEAT repeat protein